MQLINHDGTVVWNEPIVLDPRTYGYYVEMVTDGQGNVILGWTSPNPAADVYCKKIDADGADVWTQPAMVCNAPSQQSPVKLAPDGVGGAIAVWSDRRNSLDVSAYMQRVSAGGSTMWQENGIRIPTLDL